MKNQRAAFNLTRGKGALTARFWNLGLIIVLLLTLLPMNQPVPAGTVVQGSGQNVQPILVKLAEEHPEQGVSVIVQAGGSLVDVMAAIEAAGGVVTRDLHMINSVAATLPAGQIPALAQAANINWISYDAPMREASIESEPLVYTTWANDLAATQSLTQDFKKEQIPAGSFIWFNALIKAKNLPSPATVYLHSSKISFVADGERYEINTPDSRVEFVSNLPMATTHFDAEDNVWITQVPANHRDRDVFLTAVPFFVEDGLTGGIKDVRWSIGLEATRMDLNLEWRWSAAIYNAPMPTDYNRLGVKPVRRTEAPSAYPNSDPAATPSSLRDCNCRVKGALGDGGSDFVGSYPSWSSVVPGFANGEGISFDSGEQDLENLLDHTGADRRYSWAGFGMHGLTGFDGVFTPGYGISKMEILLHTYVPAPISKDVKLQLFTETWSHSFTINRSRFNEFVGQEAVIALDITNARGVWHWWELSEMVLAVDHRGFGWSDILFYDAIGLQVTNTPGEPEQKVKFPKESKPEPIKVDKLREVFPHVVGATQLWNEAPRYLQGQGITVAVVDSGVAKTKDFGARKFMDVNFNRDRQNGSDKYGHGTFVAGMLAANGKSSKGHYMGIAPNASVLNVRVSNDRGMSTEADVIAALQWVMLNQDLFKIRVVNMSLNSSVAQSYHTSPLSIAAEILWFSGIVVVVSAGNNGTADLYPPANDPYVITVGATDDRGTLTKVDDIMAHFSAYGRDEAGNVKPELVAPGTDIIAYLPNNGNLTMGREHWANREGKDLFRMSGTSMAAPVVAGIAVLLLQSEPDLTPDQVKHRLMSTADRNWPGYDPERAGAGYVDGYAAVHTRTYDRANQNVMPAMPLAQMAMIAYWASQNGEGVDWDNINWDSVNWNSVNWNSVNWNSVNWNSVNWNSVNWNSVNWNSVNWNSVNWNSVNWNSVNWNSVNWNSVNWNSVNWNSVNWNSTYWDSTQGVDPRSIPDADDFWSDAIQLPEIRTLFLPSVQR